MAKGFVYWIAWGAFVYLSFLAVVDMGFINYGLLLLSMFAIRYTGDNNE